MYDRFREILASNDATLQLFAEVDDFLRREARGVVSVETEAHGMQDGSEILRLDIPRMETLHPALRRAAIREAVSRLSEEPDWTAAHVEAVLSLIEGEHPSAEADLDNLRRRSRRLTDEALRLQRRDLLSRFLEVADNLERALSHVESDPAALVGGVEGIARDLARLLAQEGVAAIAALGEPFDPALHEAVGVVPVPGGGEDRVVAVERTGYTVDGDLLRPARVLVGRASDAAAGDGDGT